MKSIAVASLCLLSLDLLKAENIAEYMQKRSRLIEIDSQMSLGNKLHLFDREILVNEKLMKWKNIDAENLNFSRHYFNYRDDMRRSKGYQIVRRMPKGAALHLHGSLVLNPRELLKLTYEEHLYVCVTENDLKFQFSQTSPNRECPVSWSLINELRIKHSNLTQFDSMLMERLTLGPEDMTKHSDENELWKHFGDTISAILSLIEYRPVREKMIYQSLQNLYDDNVMYAEFRIGLHSMYELNGTVHDKIYMATLHDQVARKFMDNHPDFAGLKLIISPSRRLSSEQMKEALDLARKLKQQLPDLIVGFDLVGHETKATPLKGFLPSLLEAKDDLDYFFHAGETNDYGTSADENLFDAVLLGSKRIGHANALIKHPALMTAVKRNDVAIEVNVISNCVLSLVKDVRSHPLAAYLSRGVPVVLSGDDPGVWGASPLSDDFYVSFAAVASRHADLRLLKQLAINSIRYSALDDRGKTRLFRTFVKKWAEFVNDVVKDDENE